MPRAIRGVLITCDPSIRSIILKIDSAAHDFVISELDDQHLVIKEGKLAELKLRLDDALKETVTMQVEESGSE